jgi:hypothetical protein
MIMIVHAPRHLLLCQGRGICPRPVARHHTYQHMADYEYMADPRDRAPRRAVARPLACRRRRPDRARAGAAPRAAGLRLRAADLAAVSHRCGGCFIPRVEWVTVPGALRPRRVNTGAGGDNGIDENLLRAY